MSLARPWVSTATIESPQLAGTGAVTVTLGGVDAGTIVPVLVAALAGTAVVTATAASAAAAPSARAQRPRRGVVGPVVVMVVSPAPWDLPAGEIEVTTTGTDQRWGVLPIWFRRRASRKRITWATMCVTNPAPMRISAGQYSPVACVEVATTDRTMPTKIAAIPLSRSVR